MTQDLALKLNDMRLRQVSMLLEWMIRNESEADALRPALAAVNSAHDALLASSANSAPASSAYSAPASSAYSA